MVKQQRQQQLTPPKTTKIYAWKVRNIDGEFELALLVLFTPDESDFSMALVCNKPVFLLNEEYFDGIEEGYIRDLKLQLETNGQTDLSALDMVRSGILPHVFDRIIDGYFSSVIDTNSMRMGGRNRPDYNEEYLEIIPGDPLITIFNIMSNFPRPEKEDSSEESEEPIEEATDSVQEPEAEEERSSEEEEEEYSVPDEAYDDEAIPEVEPEESEEMNEEIDNPTSDFFRKCLLNSYPEEEDDKEEVTMHPAIPDEFDKLVSDANLVVRNLQKIVDLQKLGAYAALDKEHILGIQKQLDQLKAQLAQTLLYM